jgi:hypothetical protein
MGTTEPLSGGVSVGVVVEVVEVEGGGSEVEVELSGGAVVTLVEAGVVEVATGSVDVVDGKVDGGWVEVDGGWVELEVPGHVELGEVDGGIEVPVGRVVGGVHSVSLG